MLCAAQNDPHEDFPMLKHFPLGLAALAVAGLSACATGSWQGAAAEKVYDQELEAKRLAEVNNNDDYWEIHKEGRIYVLSDLKGYQIWLQTDEIPLVVSRIGVGPQGETVKMGLIKSEAKAMEKIVGFKGGAQRMYEGELQGLEKGFYGEIHREGKIHVFARGSELAAYRKSGSASGRTETGLGPKGEAVVFVGAADNADTIARFKSVYGKAG